MSRAKFMVILRAPGFLILGTLLQFSLLAQLIMPPSDNLPPYQDPSRVEYDQSTEIGPHHKIHTFTSMVTDPNGQLVLRTNKYVQIETGMHFFDTSTATWREAKELIEVYPSGAIAQHGQHKVIFNANLNTAGAIDLLTPDGKRLRSHVLSLNYFDASTGDYIRIGTIQDSIGVLISQKQILYPSALSNSRLKPERAGRQSGVRQPGRIGSRRG